MSCEAGVTIQAPQLDINTVAAGGGSRLFFRQGIFQASSAKRRPAGLSILLLRRCMLEKIAEAGTRALHSSI